MSIAGGMSNAIDRGAKVGAKAIQVFTKNNNRWEGKPLTEDDIEAFHTASMEHNVSAVASHDCYLINLASPDPVLHKKSITAFLDEIDRADVLKIPYLVFHPGAHMGQGESIAIDRVAKTLDTIIEQRPDSRVNLTIETTAGQGTGLGYTFQHIADIIGGSRYPSRFGVCVDTCHIFAAGYDYTTKEGYKKTFDEFDRLIGLDYLKMFHVNDSKKALSTRVDRHEHIGKGYIGLAGFRHLVNDPRFFDTPMILETPKGDDGMEDIENLKTLAGLVESA